MESLVTTVPAGPIAAPGGSIGYPFLPAV